MNTTQKVLIGIAAAAVVIGGVAIGLTLSKSPDKIDLSTIHTEAAVETMAPTAAPTAAPAAPATEAEKTPQGAGTADGVTATLDTYASGKVSIQYPVVDKMDDPALQAKVNELLKSNALSYLKANQIDETKDTLTVKCQVTDLDRKRLTAIYTGQLSAGGAAHPVNIFYSNTVDLPQASDMGLRDFADAYTMAGYVLSDDVKFAGLSADEKQAVLEYRSTLNVKDLTAAFNGADFPLSKEGTWPESFSYQKQGTTCFSMEVPHALGDYVIVTFDPTTK